MKDSEKKPKSKEGFFTKISKYTDLSLRSGKGFQLDIYSEKSGYKSIVAYNVKRIEKYTETCIILEMNNEKISFMGKSLECITYASEAIEIDGDIEEINFSKVRGGENV